MRKDNLRSVISCEHAINTLGIGDKVFNSARAPRKLASHRSVHQPLVAINEFG